MKFKIRKNINESLSNKDKQIYIRELNKAEDREDLEDIIHEIFFYDKSLFAKLRKLPKDEPLEVSKERLVKIINDSMEESLNEASEQDDLKVVYTDFFKGPIVLSEPDSIQTAKNIADEYAINITNEYGVPSTVEVKDSLNKVVYSVSSWWEGNHCFIMRDGKEMRVVPKWNGFAYKLTEDTIKQNGK